MSSSTTYDDLLKQVETLRAENTTLRRELNDNSSHLTQLETDATSMKDGLLTLHTSLVQQHEEVANKAVRKTDKSLIIQWKDAYHMENDVL